MFITSLPNHLFAMTKSSPISIKSSTMIHTHVHIQSNQDNSSTLNNSSLLSECLLIIIRNIPYPTIKPSINFKGIEHRDQCPNSPKLQKNFQFRKPKYPIHMSIPQNKPDQNFPQFNPHAISINYLQELKFKFSQELNVKLTTNPPFPGGKSEIHREIKNENCIPPN